MQSSREPVWRYFFDRYAPKYMNEGFTRDTSREVDFIESELELIPGASVLDVGCGTGRHSLELARRGYAVTGLDLSPGMLAEAAKVRDQEGLRLELVQADATDFALERSFEAAICLCEGAFGLIDADDDPFTRDVKILRNVAAVLKPGGKFLLTALNALRSIRCYSDRDVADGRFDPLGMVEVSPVRNLLPEAPEDLLLREKAFTVGELRCLLREASLRPVAFWGGTAGRWGKRPLELDEMELMAIAERPLTP